MKLKHFDHLQFSQDPAEYCLSSFTKLCNWNICVCFVYVPHVAGTIPFFISMAVEGYRKPMLMVSVKLLLHRCKDSLSLKNNNRAKENTLL